MSPVRFATIRRACGLTPRQLARVLGLNPKSGFAHIVDIEAGKDAPSGPVACAMEALESGWRPAHFRAALAGPADASELAMAG